MEVAKSENFVNTIQTQEKEIEQRLRDVLENDPNDFDTWLELVKHIETYDSLENNQAVYQEILDIYPQCFGFWRKLADIYNVQKQIKQVIDTYEQGLKYLPVCVELWMPYCTWKAENFPFMEAEALYERAVEACGKVYNSSVLWDRFLDFEKRNFQYEKMGDIFWRLVQIPTNKLYEYYTRFRSFINSPGRKLEHYGISLPERDPAESDIDFATRCEDLRKARLDQILSTYDTTVIENNKRKQFETRIKRSFFHVKPLEETQLQNWREYLEFEEKEGSDARVVLLYERAIVATCYYPEFWVRYANYIEHTLDDSAARVLYELAIERFLTSRPDGYIAQAVFEETHGNLDKARSLYKAVYEQVTPGLLEGIFGHLHLERRAENFEIVETLYQQAFEVASGQEEVYVYVT